MTTRCWLGICLVLWGLVFATIAAQQLFPVPTPFRSSESPAWRLFAHAFTAVLVGIVWAICFRPQLEKGRLTILSLFALIAMQAVYLWMIRVMHPWG